MIAPGDNRLAVLAAEIRDADGRFKRSTLESAVAAIDAGNRLIEAKSLVKHGQWLPWLKDNCQISERSAQLFMQLARSGLNPQPVADLGIRGAAEALAKHKTPEQEAADPWFGVLPMPCRQPSPGELVIISVGDDKYPFIIWPHPDQPQQYCRALWFEYVGRVDGGCTAVWTKRGIHWRAVRYLVEQDAGICLDDPDVSIMLSPDSTDIDATIASWDGE